MSRLLRGATAQLLLITVLPLTLFLAIISFGSLAMHQQAMRELVVERDIRAVKAAASSIGVILQHTIDVRRRWDSMRSSIHPTTRPASAHSSLAQTAERWRIPVPIR
jgi:hypothetical protein